MTWIEFLLYQEEGTEPETAKSKVGGWTSASEPWLLYFQSWTLKWQGNKAISFARLYEALLFFFLLTVHFVDPQGLAPELCEWWRGHQGSTCYSTGFFPYLCSGIFQWAWKSTVKPENEKKKKKKNRERVLKESFFMYFCTFKDLKRYVLKCSAKMWFKKKKISESSIKDKQVKITPVLPKKKWEDRLNKSKMWIIAEA